MKFRIAPTSLSCAACASLPPGERCPDRCARNFVLSGWSSSSKDSREAGMITAEDWVDVMHVQIAKIVARPECRVLVAHGEPGVYLGFIAGEPDERIVYFCYVKSLYRRSGIARALFESLGIDPRGRFAYPMNTRFLETEKALRPKIPYAVRDRAVFCYPKNLRHRSYA